MSTQGDANKLEDETSNLLTAEEEIEIDVDADDDQTLQALKLRCQSAGIEIREREYEDGQRFTSILLPAGREKRVVPASGGRARALLETEFEKFVFLRGLEAICCYPAQYIEAAIRGYPTPFSLIRQIDAKLGEDPESGGLAIEDQRHQQGPKVVIGYRSNEFGVLVGGPSFSRGLSIKIFGGGFAGHDEALELLKKLAHSIGFQMDLALGSGFGLVQERIRRYIPRRRLVRALDEVKYPTHEYENAPMSLYWYARDARGLPLLRFLALYQCIEFFFPTYAETEAKRRVSLILKDPSFRLDRDSDLARVLTAVRLGRSGFGDEKAQLKSVLDECIDPKALRDFIESDQALSDHISNTTTKSKFHKIPVANRELDLRMDVASRLYDIRCKIVHTKDEQSPHGRGMILPFTDEANSVEYDNVLVEFIAQRVLISSSVPIRFLS